MDIYKEILSALESEDRLILATIISTNGSTPASALSKMLVKQEGTVSVGTVGGGCMEGEVLLHANRLYNSEKAEILSFHLNEDDVEHGLICGGSLDVLLEPVTKRQIPFFQSLQKLRESGEDCVVATLISSNGKVEMKQLIRPDDANDQLVSRIRYPESDLSEPIRQAYRHQQTYRLHVTDGELILEPVPGTPELIIFGGGHVSKFVSRIASIAGFRVTIIDDRERFSNSARFPEAQRTIIADYAEAFQRIQVHSSTYLLIVSRGHLYDEMLLEHAVQTPAKYIGMIGSVRKVLRTYQHLAERGVSTDQLERVHAPVGIEIEAVTAEEIAVSIVAQLIHIRRGGAGPILYKSKSVLTSEV